MSVTWQFLKYSNGLDQLQVSPLLGLIILYRGCLFMTSGDITTRLEWECPYCCINGLLMAHKSAELEHPR